jgi:hypothetical protein
VNQRERTDIAHHQVQAGGDQPDREQYAGGSAVLGDAPDRPGESPNESFQAGKNGQQKVAL